MRKKITRRKQEMPLTTKNITGVLISSALGIAIIVVLTLLISLILTKSSVISDSVGVYFIGCVMIGAIFTGFFVSKKCSFKGLVSGVIASVPLSLGVTVIMLIFSQGQLSSKTAILYLGMIVCSTIGGIFSANTKRRK